MKLTYIFISYLLLISNTVNSQIPSYYQNIDFNLDGESLKHELSILITNTHTTPLIYTPDVWNVLKLADLNPDETAEVLLLYGWNDTDIVTNNDRNRDRNATCHTSNCADKWVREHVYPRSKGTPNLGFEGPGSDAHHLRAVDYDRNSLRSNFKFIANPSPFITYSRVILQNGIEYFYPGDEWKGDVARMVMYMYVRYHNQCQPVNVGFGNTTYSPNNDMPNIFLIWNAEDPVSAHEIQRNEMIYSAQGNRNPFIDNPYLATKIWNGPTAENKWQSLNQDIPLLNNIAIYPTYTDNYINILGVSLYTYKIIDSSGKIIIKKNDEFSTRIDVSNLKDGIYFLHIDSDKKTSQHKFIKR